jgi:hypothetical protein
MSTRLPRFKRAQIFHPIHLTERDHQIIRLIHQHRFLRSPQIIELMKGSPQGVLRRLQLLYHHGYLERPRAQIEYYHRGGSRHIIYGLGNKGAAVLKLKQSRGVRWGEKNRAVGRIYLEHALSVSDVMVALELACRKSERCRLLGNDEFPKVQKSFRWNVNVGGGVKLGVIPDQVFGLETTSEDGTTNRAYFFLEADRGTMPVMRSSLTQTSIYRKLLAYEATWSQELHRTKFGFHRFRVLIVTKSAERMKSLVEACSKLKRGQGLFLFAEEETLKKHGDILTLPWKSGRGDTARLLD